MKKNLFVIACIAAIGTMTFPMDSARAEGTLVLTNQSDEEVRAYWTPERIAAARPMPLPVVHSGTPGGDLVEEPATSNEVGETADWPLAQGPTLTGPERFQLRRKLFDLSLEELRVLRGFDGQAPVSLEKNLGTSGLNYTSSRLIPTSAVTAFPYSAVGKLFYRTPEGEKICSGAVIGRRIVLTAGHCVYGSQGYYDSFYFAPAYENGTTHLGVWTASAWGAGQAWRSSLSVPNREDWAILVMNDIDGTPISARTGTLTFITGKLADNHLTMLGYPANLDDGEEMHQCLSGDHAPGGANTVVYGCDMEGGSSGGPWVQNFDRKARGQAGGQNKARLAVVGVTSYFTPDGGRSRDLGASVLTQSFRALRQEACQSAPGNC